MNGIKGHGYYGINTHTMIILPMYYNGKVYSRIIELNGEFHSPSKPIDIIKRNCLDNGCDYEGMVNGSRYILGKYQKVPIVIDAENQICFFPTVSPEQADCIWINPIHIHQFKSLDKKRMLVVFKNNQAIEVPVSEHTFTNQISRALTLQNRIMQRLTENRGQMHFLYLGNADIASHVFEPDEQGEEDKPDLSN